MSMYTRVWLAFFVSAGIAVSGCGLAFAQETGADVTAEPGITAADPSHIFERLGDWMRLNVLTLNSVRKAEVRMDIAEKRLSELKKVVEGGADAALAERAEALYRAHVEAMERQLQSLDDRGQNVGGLVDRFNTLSLRHQAVLGRVLTQVPDEAKAAIQKSLDTSERGLAQATKVVENQFEKGNLTKDQARAIVEHTTNELEKKIAILTRDLDLLRAKAGTIPNSEKEFFEARIRGLENFLAELESRRGLKDIRDAIRLDVSNAANRALEAREAQGIRDTASEDSLRAIQNREFDPVLRAKRMITAAAELIAQLERRIKEAMDAKKDVPEKVIVLAKNANDHLAKARSAFDAKDFGEAFGQANSAIQNAKNALAFFDALKRGSEGEETTERICALVITPARNAAGECRVFPNACLPDGWKADRSCAAGEVPKPIQDIFPQVVPKPTGEVVTIPRTLEVKITDEGFSPRELVIRKGDTVVWTNGGSRPHWPASAMHPTHAVYPEPGGCIGSMFDACKGLETGEKYSFTFNHTGAWRYHDHMNASSGGSITVIE